MAQINALAESRSQAQLMARMRGDNRIKGTAELIFISNSRRDVEAGFADTANTFSNEKITELAKKWNYWDKEKHQTAK
jgi:hypothetical protein